jgi:cystathionine beta-lyase/cystathionine gamma-synthase
LDNFIIPDNIKVIIHGSILKAPQLGMERIYAGFVLSFGLDKFVNQILEYRTLSGSSIQDFGGYLLPVTTKKLLQNRLRIIERNTTNIATFLSKIDANKEIFGEIVYPGIQSHKDFSMVKKIGFAGPFFNIKLISKLKNDKYYELFTSEVIKCAKRNNCDIVHGASYGFNITSIYYSVGWDTPDKHYLRLSIGTETAYEIEKIKMVFKEVFQIFKKKYIS